MWNGHAPALPKLGVPAMWHMECQHGLWNGAGAGGTQPNGCLPASGNSSGARQRCPSSFPTLVTLGATFNRSAVHAVATAIASEGRAMNNYANGADGAANSALAGLTCWSPNTNLIKDPRCEQSRPLLWHGRCCMIDSRACTPLSLSD